MGTLRLDLIPPVEELPPPGNSDYQRELSHFANTLTSAGLEVFPKSEMFIPFPHGEILLGMFSIEPATVTAATAAPLCEAIVNWLQTKDGRKVKLKIGDIEAEAQTMEQVEQFIARNATSRR
jgi:hypothetical protein